jgi:hypothetical protein
MATCLSRGQNFMLEAFVYTQSRAVEVRCSEAFATLPLDWTMLCDIDEASAVLARNRFHLVILDVDTPEGSAALLQMLTGDDDLPSAVLAVSSAAVDSSLLQMCYRAQVFYPVRPQQVREAICQAFPLAENLSAQIDAAQRINAALQQEDETIDLVVFRKDSIDLGAAVVKSLDFTDTVRSFAADVVRMKHSLSIVAHERLASVIASAGMMWYVQELTSEFTGIELINPPSAGPTYLIALSLLLWLCAKSRRASQRSFGTAPSITSDSSTCD